MMKVLHSLAPTRLSAVFKESNAATICNYSIWNTSKTAGCTLPIPQTALRKALAKVPNCETLYLMD